jgi:hypothetical protein
MKCGLLIRLRRRAKYLTGQLSEIMNHGSSEKQEDAFQARYASFA